MEQAWSSVIILVDMNCFFAQIEQQDNPFWRNRPIAVTNGIQGSTIITSSYEARAYGVKTGMRLKEARLLCPELIQAPSRPHRYADVSTNIMASLQSITPDLEIYSVDEAFLDVTHCQSLLGTPLQIAQLVKDTVSKVSGLTCSVGVSGDKTTAKYAAKLNKPDGLTQILPWEAEATLAPLHVTELSGINTGTANFLKQYGVINCGDIKNIPISIPAKRFGNLGRRLWLMAQGGDPEPVSTTVKEPKTIGHGKVMPPQTEDLQTILTYFQHMSEKVTTRLRKHHFKASQFYIGLKTEQGWLQTKVKLSTAIDDGQALFTQCRQFVMNNWNGQGAWQVQVTALNPHNEQQADLFADNHADNKRQQLNNAIDEINQRYGEFTVAPSRLIDRSAMPNVIAPAWKPFGHRKTI
ncbi:MAG: DNA polymerase IV [Methylococcaceae bacterium]|nr:DNA polymerase IV [Methylococcaceae bacterium]